MRVTVSVAVLRGFIRRAKRAYPLEFIECAFGRLENGMASIHAFYPLEHKAGALSIDFDDEEIEDAKDHAQEQNLVCLGTMHSHPECEPTPSATDIASGAEDGEIIMGICSLWKKGKRLRCEVKFWPRVEPLKMEVR
jgi:proteasome lid subunit RPN8/RPN11